MSNALYSLLALCFTIYSAASAMARPPSGPSLEIDCHGFDASREPVELSAMRITRFLVLVTGSDFAVSVGIRHGDDADSLYSGLHPTWPEGLRFEAGEFDSVTTRFVVVPKLIDRLGMEFYQSTTQVLTLERLRSGKEAKGDNEVDFVAHVPADLQGRTIYVRAIADHPKWGTLLSKQVVRLSFIAPRDSTDVDLVRTSLIEFAQDAQKCQRAVEIADSLIALGYRDVRGLDDAQMCAQKIGQFDKSIAFLDLNFQANGRTSYISPPSRAYSEGEVAGYNRMRARLLELKARQEQE